MKLQAVGEKRKEYDKVKALLTANPSLAEHYSLDALKNAVTEAETQLAELISRRDNIKTSIAIYEQYLKLFESIPVILEKIRDMAVMNELLRIFFSKFVIEPNNGKFNKESKVSYKLKEPWDGFVLDRKFVLGALPRIIFTRNQR